MKILVISEKHTVKLRIEHCGMEEYELRMQNYELKIEPACRQAGMGNGIWGIQNAEPVYRKTKLEGRL